VEVYRSADCSVRPLALRARQLTSLPCLVSRARTTLAAVSRIASFSHGARRRRSHPLRLVAGRRTTHCPGHPSAGLSLSQSRDSSRSPVNFACLKSPSSIHSICTTSSGLTHTQFFISSRVSAHCVRLRSGRLAKRHASICKPLSLAATSRRLCARTRSEPSQHKVTFRLGSSQQ